MKYTIGDVFTPEAIEQLNAFDANQSEIEALKAQLVESEKQAYWQGFETGSNNPHQNIKMFYFEWQELIKSNQQGDSNGK